MTTIAYHTEHGLVRGFRYHDGQLTGLCLDDTLDAVELSLTALSGERHVVRVEGLADLRVNDFWRGNIVGNLWWLPLAEAAVSSARGDVLRERLDGYLPALLRPGARLLVVECSFGAQVLAVGRSMSVRVG